MNRSASGAFGARLKSLRESAGFTQEELATISGLSVHAVSALERGERRRPHVETVRALAAALDLSPELRNALMRSARTATAPRVESAGVNLLPPLLTPLVGREADLRMLNQWLADPRVRLITLVGPGGVGKTRLALEMAHSAVVAGAQRVVFVGLASVRDSAFVASTIAESFGMIDPTETDLPRRIRAACGDAPTLLVLDNCEHVLEAMPLIVRVLGAAPFLRVLATSRAPLRVRGEREYAVGPLATEAEPDPRGGLPRVAPALRLFVDRVRDFDPGFQLAETNSPIVVAICRRLDALPLAIELAAPWLKVLLVHDLLRRLDHGVLSPTLGPRDLPARQQTMNATVAWSYQLLVPHEQRSFRRLGVLPGPFSIEAVAAVLSDDALAPAPLDDAQRATAGLIERSLLTRAQGALGSRAFFRMLETVRAYALTELTASGERGVAMEGLARYCATAAAAAEAHLMGPEQGEWLDRVRDDLESYRTAMTWLIERGRAADACEMAWSLLFFWLIRGHTSEGLRWYEQLGAQESLPPSDRAATLVGTGVMLYAQGQIERARHACTDALTTADGATTIAACIAEAVLGHIALAVGDVPAAHARLTTAIAGFEALGVDWAAGHALGGRASAALAARDLGATERFVAQASALVVAAGPWCSLSVLYVQAALAVRRNEPDNAIAYVRESLARIHKVRDTFAFLFALAPLAAAAELKGDDAWAARIVGVRDGLTERTGATAVDDSMRDLWARVERDARGRLGERRWAREYETGRTASIESLMKEVEAHTRDTFRV